MGRDHRLLNLPRALLLEERGVCMHGGISCASLVPFHLPQHSEHSASAKNYCTKPFSPPKLQTSHATCVLWILMMTLLGIISHDAFRGPSSGSISWCCCIVGWNRHCRLPAQALRFAENRLQTTQIPAVCWTRTSLKKPFLVQIIPLITKSVVTAPGLYQNQ